MLKFLIVNINVTFIEQNKYLNELATKELSYGKYNLLINLHYVYLD